MPYFGTYVSQEGAKRLLHYRYKGSDDSFMLKHVTNPLYNKWVLYFPTWLAPNIITLIGLLFTVLGHCLVAVYSPNLEGPIPSWVSLYNAFAVLAYQAFDAMDGKQARRTGSGSPLGMLFDHGCDALNCTVMALTVVSTIQLGPSVGTVIFCAVAWAGFFAATLEEYYTGELHLPIINGPNEGLHASALLYVMAAFLPSSWWNEPSSIASFFLGSEPPLVGRALRWNEFVVLILLLVGVVTILYNLLTMVRAVSRRKADIGLQNRSMTAAERESNSFAVAFSRFIPLIFVIGGFVVWCAYSPSGILRRHPRMLLWTVGIAVCKLVTGIMLAHLCEEEYHPFSRTIACLCSLLLHTLLQLFGHFNLNAAGEELLLFEAFGVLVLSYFHLVSSVVSEMSKALGIYVFTITSKRPVVSKSVPASTKVA